MKVQIRIDDTEYEAEIEVIDDDAQRPPPHASRPSSSGSGIRHAPAPAAAPPPVAPADSGAKGARSAVVGIVVRILARVGQSVAAGETLLVLEAMKMESNVTAPVAGRVKAIPVKQGEGVTKGQLLVELE